MTRVLLVDDEPAIVAVLSTTLRAHGCAVRTAASAQDAMLALAEEVPDVMLLDINLPDLTGWELLRRLAPRDRERVPGIVFSASPLAPSRVEEFHPEAVSGGRPAAAGARSDRPAGATCRGRSWRCLTGGVSRLHTH